MFRPVINQAQGKRTINLGRRNHVSLETHSLREETIGGRYQEGEQRRSVRAVEAEQEE